MTARHIRPRDARVEGRWPVQLEEAGPHSLHVGLAARFWNKVR